MNDLQSAMLSKILEERQRIMSGYDVDIVDTLPQPKDLIGYKGSWTDGQCSLTNRKLKWRIVSKHECIIEQDTILTYTDINYTYLALHYKDFPKTRNWLSVRQREAFQKNTGQIPHYAIPYSGKAVYFDLKGFHRNIMLAFGRDVDYSLSGKIHALPNNDDYPYWHVKEAGNRLYAAAYPAKSQQYIPEGSSKSVRRATGNPYENLALIKLTNEISAAIGFLMVTQGGAIYANRDGYIVPQSSILQAFSTLDFIAFPYTIKQAGECKVYTYGAYDFEASAFGDGHKTKLRLINQPVTYLPTGDHYALIEQAKQYWYQAPLLRESIADPSYVLEELRQ